ncbi:MAG TPA: hypothetical protein DCM05_10195 [Elusimicrobia bacterium]|nr:hypothetical protein [Elusimicrobiota bacterium]
MLRLALLLLLAGTPGFAQTADLPDFPAVPAVPARPKVHARSEWNARKAKPIEADEKKERIIVHHTDILIEDAVKLLRGTESWKASAEHAKAVQRLHMSVNGWDDVGYHYLVDWEGRILEGRKLDSLGAHTEDHNPGSIGIAVMGNFEAQHPTRKQLQALRDLADWLSWAYGFPPERILGHKDFNATACPGRWLLDNDDKDTPLRLIRLSILAERQLSKKKVPAISHERLAPPFDAADVTWR